MQINSYKTLDFLPIFNFYQAEETGDLRYLLKLDDYEELPEYNTKPLEVIFERMNYEYQDIAVEESRKTAVLTDIKQDIEVLQAKYNLIQLAISSLAYGRDEELVKILADNGYRIIKNRDFETELTRIKRLSKQLLTKAEIKRGELQEMSGQSSKKTSIYATIEAVERHRGITIDEKTMPMKKWLTMMYRVVSETQKKALKNG